MSSSGFASGSQVEGKSANGAETPQAAPVAAPQTQMSRAAKQLHRSLKAWRDEKAEGEEAEGEDAGAGEAGGANENANAEEEKGESEAESNEAEAPKEEATEVSAKHQPGGAMRASVLRQILRKSSGTINRRIFRASPGSKSGAAALTTGHVPKKPPGLKKGERSGGHPFGNKEKRLPEKDATGKAITYTEYDVNKYDGVNRDAERIVVGSDGKHYYTGDHYGSFTELK